MTRRAAVYNRFWHSRGGGERHSGMIASVLSQDGVEIDLLGHTRVDRDELADHLGLDLSGCRLRIEPDRGDLQTARLSAGYDLFVNGSYMSRLAPRATRNAYLCYFPTPFDADLPPMRRIFARRLGRYVRAYADGLDYGVGWFPPEGGRRRQWRWTSGDAVLALQVGAGGTLRMEVGAPGRPEPATLRVQDSEGQLYAEVPVAAGSWQLQRIALPARSGGTELHLRSGVFTPGRGDDRSLGVAVSRLRLEGRHRGVRQAAAHRFPWLLRDATDLSFLSAYDTVLANSDFTRDWVRRLWGVRAEVLFPPVQVQRLVPRPDREQAVVTVGRFFAPGLGHAKRQLEMVEFFGRAMRAGRLPGWRLYVVGGCEDSQRPYLDTVRAAAQGLPVEVIANAPRGQFEQLLTTSSVFWSATGYGTDENRTPWFSEHFGMTTVEAMAGGCVPVVIDRAGQKEIVRDGVDGFRWTTPEQLLDRTVQLAGDDALRARLAASSASRAHAFDEGAFADRWQQIVSTHRLLG